MRNQKIHKALAVASVTLMMGWSTAAVAADFFVFGTWHNTRGLAVLPLATGGNVRNAASAQVSQPGGTKQTLVFGTSAFSRPGSKFSQALAYIAPSLVQLATTLTFEAPTATNRTIVTGPKASRGVNFSACPANGILTGCTAGMIDPALSKDGRLVYTASAAQFGGVMQMMMSGTGTVTIKIGDGTDPAYSCPIYGLVLSQCPLVLNSGFGGGGGVNPQLPGAVLGDGGPIVLAAGAMAQVTATGTCLTGMKGCIVGSFTIGQSAGGGNIQNWGAPFTAGDVHGSVLIGRLGGRSTQTGMGSDNRTAGGSGNLTLVAGGISNRMNAGNSYVMLDKVTARLAPVSAVTGSPSMGPAGLAAFTALLALAGGYSLRRRSRRED